MVMLYFSGNSYKDLEYGFRVANNTISLLVPDTCEAILDAYCDEFLRLPETPQEWLAVAEGFKRRWNWQNCLGALDGKHIRVRCPPHSGSVYYNYKGFFSIVLFALVDCDYRFLFVDVAVVAAGEGRVAAAGAAAGGRAAAAVAAVGRGVAAA